MATFTISTGGFPSWIDLLTTSIEASRSFYKAVLGWESTDPIEQFGGYFNFLYGGGMIAGGVSAPQSNPSSANTWTIYLGVEDAATTVSKVASNGGVVHHGVTEVSTLGKMAIVGDPSGATIGIWEPGEHKGFSVFDEDGAPGYFELHTRDFAKSIAFYESVFGISMNVVSDSEDFRYNTAGIEGSTAMGFFDASRSNDDQPSRWYWYARVTDCDETAEKIRANGGSLIMEPTPTPYGKMAVAKDSTGTIFRVVS
ncbi:MAG: VOC family protein [Actinomycetota bacterium]|nr:VOC family protein [Actinomycetota bacterium]